MLKDILLYLDSIRDNDPATSVALGLARSHGSHLAALSIASLWHSGALIVGDSGGMGLLPAAIYDELWQQEVAASRTRIATAQALAARDDQPLEARSAEDNAATPAEILTCQARHADLTVIGLDRDARGNRWMTETALLGCGRPILFVPPDTSLKPSSRILVAWDGGREATRAVHDALPLLREADLVTVLSVGHRGDARFGAQPGADISTHLARHGIRIETLNVERSASDAGEIIVRELHEGGHDLLVMGGYAHSRGREMILGGATRSVFCEAQRPFLLSH